MAGMVVMLSIVLIICNAIDTILYVLKKKPSAVLTAIIWSLFSIIAVFYFEVFLLALAST